MDAATHGQDRDSLTESKSAEDLNLIRPFDRAVSNVTTNGDCMELEDLLEFQDERSVDTGTEILVSTTKSKDSKEAKTVRKQRQ